MSSHPGYVISSEFVRGHVSKHTGIRVGSWVVVSVHIYLYYTFARDRLCLDPFFKVKEHSVGAFLGGWAKRRGWQGI